MKHDTVTAAMLQLSRKDLGKAMQDFIRHTARCAITDILQEEVSTLCGERHVQGVESRNHQRGGSSNGYVVVEGRKEDIVRPRVRKKSASGSEEVVLKTYKSLQDRGVCLEDFITASINGVSTRNMEKVFPESPNSSKSEISRLLKKHGAECFKAFRNRDISKIKVVGLMLDGIHLSKDIVAIAALVIDSDGRKHFIDFEIGASEDYTNAHALTARLVERGLTVVPKHLLALLDGAAAGKI